MARQKGDGKGRMGGRAKGTPNKTTAALKEWISRLVEKNKRQIERDIKELEAKDRLMILEKFMQYAIPKQQAVRTEIDINALSDEQLELLINQLTNNIDED